MQRNGKYRTVKNARVVNEGLEEKGLKCMAQAIVHIAYAASDTPAWRTRRVLAQPIPHSRGVSP